MWNEGDKEREERRKEADEQRKKRRKKYRRWMDLPPGERGGGAVYE